MNILFVSISSIPDVKIHSISLDLLREFQRAGNHVSIICALEKNNPMTTYLSEEEGFNIVRVRIGGNKKAGLIEKGITTLLEPYKYISAIKKFYSDEKFDLVLYPTPPVTQVKTVEFVKKRDGAKSYLLLKDIFPQNAVDIGMMKKTGIKGLIYRHFRRVEKKLYQVSDRIGCMSEANVQYLLDHNPEIDPHKVEVCPNSIELNDKSIDSDTRDRIRLKYEIPSDKTVFIYGGNLGKPQGIPFLIDCMERCKDIKEAFFIIVGDGTEYRKLAEHDQRRQQSNVRLMKKLPKDDYDTLVAACDVGLIFLDYKFTIPNFPSRLLAYMQAHLPVIAATDPCTDVGEVIQNGSFGWWCESNNAEDFYKLVIEAVNTDKTIMKKNAFQYLVDHYQAVDAYKTIVTNL